MSHLRLVRAVIIHGPDFFVSAPAADESNLRLRDAGKAAAQLRDDVVGKLVRQAARVGVGGCAAIDFLQRDGRSGIVNVGQKTRGGQVCAVYRQVSVGDHVCAGGRV